jgi:hypothetical protein
MSGSQTKVEESARSEKERSMISKPDFLPSL